MTTLALPLHAVNPVAKPAPVVMTDAEFSAWCAAQLEAPAPLPCPAFVPTVADDGPAVVPALIDVFYETGYQIGLDGSLVFVEETSIGHLAPAGGPEYDAFAIGHRAGRTRHAWLAGQAWGHAGRDLADAPYHVSGWWVDAFAAGYALGDAERAEMLAEMAAYFERLDWEHAREREMEEAELINRENFYSRTANYCELVEFGGDRARR